LNLGDEAVAIDRSGFQVSQRSARELSLERLEHPIDPGRGGVDALLGLRNQGAPIDSGTQLEDAQ
jgi:hypothetical protein